MTRKLLMAKRAAASALVVALCITLSTAYSPPVPELKWGPCPGDESGPVQCATATVPLDYTASCAGPTITIAVAKVPAAPKNASQTKLGTLWVNRAYPGIGGVQFLAGIADSLFPKELLERFDIASFDQRGISTSSTYVQCFDAKGESEAVISALPAIPKGPEDAALYERLAEQCARRNGALLNHLSTADAAMDLDLLRQAFGDKGLYYLGARQGATLGTVYANMFPDKVKGMVLDSVVDPEEWFNPRGDSFLGTAARIGQDLGYQRALERVLELCGNAKPGVCPFSGGSYASTRAKFGEVLAALRDGRSFGIPEGAFYEYSAPFNMTYDVLFRMISTPLRWAHAAKGACDVLQMAWLARNNPPAPPESWERTSRPSNASVYYSSTEAAIAFACGESPKPRDLDTLLRQSQQEWPRAGGFSRRATLAFAFCSRWKAQAKHVYRGPWNKTTSAPILVTGNTHDPITPYENAERLAFARLASARLLKVEGLGHGVLGESDCADAHIIRYLTEGVLPPEDAVCQVDYTPFKSAEPNRRAMKEKEMMQVLHS